jgi:HAD superfamily hydrolase (TIGR01484 family)
MRYRALATDYDGTLADDGRVAPSTLDALLRLFENGCRIVLATGRELDDLRGVFPQYALFDRVVAENGAVVYDPATRTEKVLGEAPEETFVARLRELGVAPLSVGRAIVATREPHQERVRKVIRELGLRREVILNKGAVMVLPADVDKARGLRTALDDLGISPADAVAVGDAENDCALLEGCGLGVAVGNALLALKERAHWITTRASGAGVVELVDRMLASDLRDPVG